MICSEDAIKALYVGSAPGCAVLASSKGGARLT